MSERLRVLYDGWPLVHAPAGPGAFHLLALLHALPADVAPFLAFPGEPPPWWHGEFGPGSPIEVIVSREHDRLAWEQQKIKALADSTGSQLIHMTVGRGPFSSRVPVVVSPSDTGEPGRERKSWRTRLGDALAQGGLSRAACVLWPADLPHRGKAYRVRLLPPITHPAFAPTSRAQSMAPDIALPETYILYHGQLSERTLETLFSAWTWAAGSIGELFPLVLADVAPHQEAVVDAMATKLDVQQTVQTLPPGPPTALATIYLRSTAIFQTAALAPWGDPVRRGMASGKALVLTESALADAMVGPAAFVLPAADSRRLGAALITTVVEENVRQNLEKEALKKAASWKMETFGRALLVTYRSLL